ncbi:MAG: tRNA-dihydrouridine synthase [Candidatus Yanofskybacteria bacterium]|nr:tRNA-dihydrouridine synthase [Candidatus Yanofskybacteria bacterium]
MVYGFWKKINTLRRAQGKPIMILAPMANVTDWAFRDIVARCGKPDVFYTEFLSCDGILHGSKKFEGELYFKKKEKPIVVQFFGSKPENFYKCAQMAQELGFDGIDINMGCPDKSVEKQGGGAALIRNPALAVKIIKETLRGSGKLPVSVKTRLGFNKIDYDWIDNLLSTDIATLSVHLRTRKEMSKAPAHWEEAGKIAKKAHRADKLLIGNGDVLSLDEAREKSRFYDLDGVMIGRGIFQNPWFFSGKKLDSPQKRIELLIRHVGNFEKLWTGGKNFDVLKRFFKIYVNGFEGAKELRVELMAAKNKEDVLRVLKKSRHFDS